MEPRRFLDDLIAALRRTAYTASLVRNHPFIDGDKRTGFVVGILFLELNDYTFTASEVDAVQAVLELAAGTLDG
ncbi:MAG TPA: type II toxin-antitoxin system death-on-curing family toxin [Xanthomonadaceae bacterium]|nr:type II toxin-antitoxin system death-on-curing family toxin [Xanthomonadaceae bacterium]